MARSDRAMVGALTGSLAMLTLVALLVIGNATRADGRDRAPVVPGAPATSRQWLAPLPTASAPSSAPVVVRLVTPVAGRTPPQPRRTRLGKRPSPEVLRTYFRCRAPAVFLAPTPLPACRPPALPSDA